MYKTENISLKFLRKYNFNSLQNVFENFLQIFITLSKHIINMFHGFALAYLTTGSLRPILLIFPLFCEPRARACTLYHSTCAMQVRPHLSIFKLTDTRSEARHETCSSSRSCDRNFFTFKFC